MATSIRLLAAALFAFVILFPAPARADGKVGVGALIGAGVGAGGAYLAAAKYGDNEGGTFCSRCFLQWGAVAIPTGAILGATIGWGIDRASRPQKTVTIAPIVTRKSRGVFVTARF